MQLSGLLRDTDPSHWLVLTGAHDLLAVETERVAHSVDRIVIHKHFSLDTFDNDIALIRLTNPVEWSQAVSPVCLPPRDLELPGGTKCVITGWGVASTTPSSLKTGAYRATAYTCRTYNIYAFVLQAAQNRPFLLWLG